MTFKSFLMAMGLLFAVSCKKSSDSTPSIDTRPLKAVLNTTVSGMTITITADKSEGDVCAYGASVYPVDPNIVFHWSFSPGTSVQGQKNASGTGYVSGTLKYVPLIATIDVKTRYVVDLEVLDKDKKSSWAHDTVTVK